MAEGCVFRLCLKQAPLFTQRYSSPAYVKSGGNSGDPIGLAYNGGSPDEGCSDEYDRYLLHVVSMISRGGSKDEATIYLIGIASEHMRLSVVEADAAAATAQAIADYLLFFAE